MEQTQIALKLVLDATGVGTDISSVDKRKAVQKAVYIAQAAGVSLGYHYNWYLKGPYSPALTRDYYPLAEALGGPTDDSDEYSLQEPAVGKIEAVKAAFDVPTDVNLKQADWLELLASLHFLLVRRRQEPATARETLQEEKPHVAPYFDAAIDTLKKAGLTP